MATTESKEDDFSQAGELVKPQENLTVRFAANISETLVYDDSPSDYDSNDLLARNSPAGSICSESQQQEDPAAKMVEVVRGQLYFLATTDMTTLQDLTKNGNYRFMTSGLQNMYSPFCDDFGPVAICQVVQFCRNMSKAVQSKSSHSSSSTVRRKVVYYCDETPRCCSNTVFLIVAYLVLELGWRIDQALKPFDHLDSSFTEPFRDATWINPPQHLLSVRDCVEGLLKALGNGWLEKFDVAQYENLEDPLSGGVNRICPKFIAFKGPVDLNNIRKGDLTSFPPHFYAQMFKRLEVDCIIRLNEPSTYDPQPFHKAGITHYDLFFEDCTAPSYEIVAKFLDICDKHPGQIAVHCTAGLGRTGTLLAVWLMRRCEFRANEAMGFLRVMRPGSVIGPQQNFLQRLESATWSNNTVLHISTWNDLYRSRSLDEAPSSFQRSASAESSTQVRRVQSEPGPVARAGADGDLFGGLMRLQKQAAENLRREYEKESAQQIAAQLAEATERRATRGGREFRNAQVGFTQTGSSPPRREGSLSPDPRG